MHRCGEAFTFCPRSAGKGRLLAGWPLRGRSVPANFVLDARRQPQTRVVLF